MVQQTHQCSHCEYKATLKHHLQTHIKSVHQGIKFQCPRCEHKATQKGDINRHVKSVHEDQKFSCPHCEYKATQKGNLKRHIKSIHEGQKFLCTQCDHKATQKRDLQKHIKSVHEGQKFPVPSSRDMKLQHCEVRLMKLSPEMIQKADVHMGENWKKFVEIKEFYLKKEKKKATDKISIYDIDRRKARETAPGNSGTWRKGRRSMNNVMMRGVDNEKFQRMKPRIPVNEAKRKEMTTGWMDTENSDKSGKNKNNNYNKGSNKINSKTNRVAKMEGKNKRKLTNDEVVMDNNKNDDKIFHFSACKSREIKRKRPSPSFPCPHCEYQIQSNSERRKDTFRDTSNQFMKVKSSHAYIVTTKQQQKVA